MEPNVLGNRIKERRKANGMTQEDLKNATGLAQSYISALEKGDRKRPSYDVVKRIADALGCLPQDLTGEDFRMEPLTWFWKARFSSLSQGELLRLRRFTIEERAQWIVQSVAEAFGADDILARTGLSSDQLTELVKGPAMLSDDQADKLSLLDLPANFLLSGDAGPTDEDLQALLGSPDSGQWLRLFKRCIEAGVLPYTLELLLDAALTSRQTR